MTKSGISRISPPAALSTSLEEDGRSAIPLVQEELIEDDQPKRGGNVTALARSWRNEWGRYGITEEMIRNICGSQTSLGCGVAPPGMYVG